MHMSQWELRGLLVAAALGAWFWTQALIGKRAFPEGRIGDAVLGDWSPTQPGALAALMARARY